MTIEDMVKGSALSCTNTQDLSAQAAQAGYAEYHSALSLRLVSSPVCLLEKAPSAVWGREHEVDVKDAEGALGQKESVAQVTPNQGG
jgi:hypothetical protein